MSSPGTHQPTPQLFLQTINSYQRTEALNAAIELEVFTAIGEGSSWFRHKHDRYDLKGQTAAILEPSILLA
jgi:5-deoxy-D-glucuronate isomerase